MAKVPYPIVTFEKVIEVLKYDYELYKKVLQEKCSGDLGDGETKQDMDLLTGNLREQGLRVLNLKEIERKQQ